MLRRPPIAYTSVFGRRNASKSSIVNAVTGQNLAIVSDTPGTTTDPVLKAMELLPLGPVVVIDTPGFDDEGPLGAPAGFEGQAGFEPHGHGGPGGGRPLGPRRLGPGADRSV